jgi:AcrR family transcriptional regulator
MSSLTNLRPADRGAQTRARILDAAELLFAERGFNGVALRDITQAAGVENALASYHFKTKDRLFTEVVLRRSEEHRRDMLERLDAALRASAPRPASNRDLVHAYAGPALEKIARGQGWAAYIKITVGIQNLDRSDPASTLTNSVYDETIKQFVAAFVAANPTIEKNRVYFSLYFLHGSLIHILSQGRTFERLIDGGPKFEDHGLVLEELAEFFSGALAPRGGRESRQ